MKQTTTTDDTAAGRTPDPATPGTTPAPTRPAPGRATAVMAALSAC
ncbi:hypothetical protein [Streptomyces sp. ITFR-16]|nr:hypothetical protein [Streptomyces sp. ITFR-16]WNI27200.1 hypothetical protein RLT58_35255 [Streptomyces sp. ITFR-16]